MPDGSREPAGLDLLDRLDHAIGAFLEEMTARTPGGRIVHQDGLLLAIGSDPSPVVVNTILPISPTIGIDAIRSALTVYDAVGNVPSLLTRDHRDGALVERLEADGYQRLIALPGMVLEARLPDEAAPSGVTLHRVEQEIDRERWIEGNLRGFGEDEPDRNAMRSAFGTLESLVGGPVTGWWAELDGLGVASAMAFVDRSTGVGVVGWVGTDVDYRHRGIGRAVTLAATNAAFDLGASLLSLQASPLGYPVYAKMGYRTVTGYKVWLAPGGGH